MQLNLSQSGLWIDKVHVTETECEVEEDPRLRPENEKCAKSNHSTTQNSTILFSPIHS